MNLIPLPVRPDLKAPGAVEGKELTDFLKDLVETYNRDMAVLRQDINRLSQKDGKENDWQDLSDRLDEIGYVLALHVQKTMGNQPSNLAFPPAPVVNPHRIMDFLRRYSFR